MAATQKGIDRYEARRNVIDGKGRFMVGTEPYAHNVLLRSGADIEPMISAQWFVKMEPLAKEAVRVVEDKEIQFIPERFAKTYLNWMENIHDWCISRQLWWGHQIPAWYCDDCGHINVSREDPTRCEKCGGSHLTRDEDVLDTWFSSALWPFSTLGWPDKTPDLEYFYPTDVLVTAYDIIFFWVARMMMMGIYVMKDVPFKDVYLHALVRDEKGEKMSKSKGNSIDPLVMIDQYGTDAFRFTLSAYTAQGRDVRMSPERIEGYKFFVNKIWNAAKLTLGNLADYDESAHVDAPDSLPEKWIRTKLNETVAAVTRSLDEYRFNDAAAAIYNFIWHEYCDWYLEISKPALYGKISAGQKHVTQRTMKEVFAIMLQLLHPFMPFVTEELWQALHNSDEHSIMISRFPKQATCRKTELPGRDGNADGNHHLDTQYSR